MRPLTRALAALCAAIVLSACDESFTPIEPSELQLSVFGYLDASADTQWIRVMPMRSTLPTSAGPLGARVTVEELGTGRVFELRDSVFRLSLNPDVGAEGVFLHNYWTTERIEPGASYRFTATPAGGAPSVAEVSVPTPYEVEVWLSQRVVVPSALRLEGLRHVAFATVTAYGYDDCGTLVERVFLGTGSPETDVQTIPIESRLLPRRDCGALHVERQELLIVGSGGEWPSGPEYSTVALGVPSGPSNVSNAVGFLGGVLSRVVPYESCGLAGPGPTESYCRLRYDAASATLTGTVRDVPCTGEPVPRATVQLREIDAVPPAHAKVRSAPSRRTGEFEIGALEGGRRYALRVTRPSPDPLQQYEEYTDTVVVAAGERATHDVPLRRVRCG